MASRNVSGSRTRSLFAMVVLPAAVLMGGSRIAVAQVAIPDRSFKWTLSVSFGQTEVASMADLEAQLNEVRLGGTAWGRYQDSFFGTLSPLEYVSRTYPSTTTRGSRRQFAASYAYRPNLGLRVQLSMDDVASARGYHLEGEITDPPAFGRPVSEHTYGAQYSRKQTARGIAFLPTVALGWLRLGVGPELNRFEISHYSLADSAGWADRIESQARERKSLLGGVAHGALIIGAKTLVYVELAAQYHFVPSVKSAPFDVRGSSGAVVATVPGGDVKSSRFVRMLGVGLRF